MLEPMLFSISWMYTIINCLSMLIMMSFNGYLILTITAAKALGHYLFMKTVQLDESLC
jgi:hypothetical protein